MEFWFETALIISNSLSTRWPVSAEMKTTGA